MHNRRSARRTAMGPFGRAAGSKIGCLREQDVEHSAAGVVGYLHRPAAPIDPIEQNRRLVDEQHGVAVGCRQVAQFPAFGVADEPALGPEMKEETGHPCPRFAHKPVATSR